VLDREVEHPGHRGDRAANAFPLDDEIDLLADVLRRVAHDARKAIEDLRHRNHAARRDLIAQLRDESRRMRDRLLERRVVQLAGQLRESPASDHELADEVHQRVEASNVDAHRAPCRRHSDWPRGTTLGRCDSSDRLGGDDRTRNDELTRPAHCRILEHVLADLYFDDVAGVAHHALDFRDERRREQSNCEVIVETVGLEIFKWRLDPHDLADVRQRLDDNERAHPAQRRVRREPDAHQRAPTARRRRSPLAARRRVGRTEHPEVRDEFFGHHLAVAAGHCRLHRGLEHVGRVKQHVHDVGVDCEIAAANAIEHRLELVRQLGDDRVPHRCAHPLDRVDGAENGAHGL